MEILLLSILWLTTGTLFAMILWSNDPYIRAKKLAKQAAEQIEILRHKWFESEKAGHDIGIEKANESWTKFHAKKWKASKK
tara:strand:+ start:85 stop:327 length:243 start_codon:yes stop_codon:yes gene_type:complete